MKIFEYEFKGKLYVANLVNNEVKFGIEVNNNIDTNLNQKELFIIKSIYNFIVGDKKDLLKLSPIYNQDKTIGVQYNPKNRLYYFYPYDEKDTLLEENTLKQLNYLLNNQNLIVARNSGGGKIKDNFKLIFKISGIITIVFITSAISLIDLPKSQNTINAVDYYIGSLYKNSYSSHKNNINYSYDDIIQTIKNNNNLQDSEKDFLIKGLKNEIEENIDYIDIEGLKKDLSELSINYHLESNMFDGTYNKFNNSIDLYYNPLHKSNYKNNQLETCYHLTLVHEINHLLDNLPFFISLDYQKIGEIYVELRGDSHILAESFNELFAREYYNDFSDNKVISRGYDNAMPIAYSLCEILDDNTLRSYKFNQYSGNFYFNNYLKSIGADITTLPILESNLDIAFHFDNYLQNTQPVYYIIKYLYETKYGMPMENDLVMLSYFYNSIYVDEDFNTMFRNLLSVNNIESIEPKGYVSKRYKEEHPNVQIIADNKVLTITDENRYIDKSYLKTDLHK